MQRYLITAITAAVLSGVWTQASSPAPVLLSAASSGNSASEVRVPVELGNLLHLRSLRDGTVVVVDATRHRLVLLQAAPKWLGGIGNGPGELYYPFDVAEGQDGTLLVLEDGNARVQVMDRAGAFRRAFAYRQPAYSILALSREDILIAHPELTGSVDVYNSHGVRVQTIGGDAGRVAIETAGHPIVLDDRLRRGLMRVHLAADQRGGFWLAYMHLPVVQRFDSRGTLLWTKKIALESLKKVVSAVWKQPPDRELMSLGDGSIQLTLVIKAVASTSQDGLVLLLGDDSLIRVTAEGIVQSVSIRGPGNGALNSIAVTFTGDILATQFLGRKVLQVAGTSVRN